MRLLADDEYMRLREKQLVQRDPALSVAVRTDEELHELLSDESNTIPVHQRMAMIEQKQARLNELLDDYRSNKPKEAAEVLAAPAAGVAVAAAAPAVAGPSTPARSVSAKQRIGDSIVDGMPVKVRAKARSVVKRLIENPDVTFDSRQHLVLGGKTVEGSNIRDLVDTMFVKRRVVPAHTDAFAHALASINLPRSLVSQSAFAKRMDEVAAARVDASTSAFATPAASSTPKAQKGKGARRVTFAAPARLMKGAMSHRHRRIGGRVRALKLYK